MSQGFVRPIPIPLPAAQGGTGLFSAGDAGNILSSDGSTWQSVSPLDATPNYGISYIMVRGIF
jgi:hypothetical protein